MTIAKYFLCILLAVSFRNVRSMSPEEMAGLRDAVMPFIEECSKQHGIDEKDIKNIKEDPNSIDDCFFACVLKKTETLDEKGMFAPEVALDIAKKYMKKEEDFKKSEKVITECTSVNDEDVNDGEAGCDRARLLITCLITHKDYVNTVILKSPMIS
ncbi:PBP/GOBP family domain-containing protein [Phthorimaea operculella]|nr:PBP/GOBP family domain-containing protein [Phthorimaea operculella]